MQLSLRQAARECGISKSTLARAVAAGRVSAERTEDGRLLFDPAELFRAFPPRPQGRPDGEGVSQDATESETSASEKEASQSRRETGAKGQDATAFALLERQVADLKERLAEMRDERDEWREQARALSNRPLMLPGPETSATRRSWWPFRRSA
jgi:hypothetical protein